MPHHLLLHSRLRVQSSYPIGAIIPNWLAHILLQILKGQTHVGQAFGKPLGALDRKAPIYTKPAVYAVYVLPAEVTILHLGYVSAVVSWLHTDKAPGRLCIVYNLPDLVGDYNLEGAGLLLK